jgi:IS1 family transposase
VGKHRASGRVVAVTHTVVLGEVPQVEALLATSATRMTIHTRFVERDHLRWREHHRRLTRQPIAFSTERPGLEKPWWLALADEHVC